MTDMVEKVGFAICSPEGHHCKQLCGECGRQARAAIRALMEPTEGMKVKATEPWVISDYQAMLKAALDD